MSEWLVKHILFAQMCKKDKTQVKETYEVYSYSIYNKLQHYLIEHVYEYFLH